jgi:hypothetical protein
VTSEPLPIRGKDGSPPVWQNDVITLPHLVPGTGGYAIPPRTAASTPTSASDSASDTFGALPREPMTMEVPRLDDASISARQDIDARLGIAVRAFACTHIEAVIAELSARLLFRSQDLIFDKDLSTNLRLLIGEVLFDMGNQVRTLPT